SPKVQKRLGELCSPDSSLCFAELSRLADLLPSPPEASEEDDVEEDELRRKGKLQSYISVTLRNADDGGRVGEHPLSTSPPSSSAHKDFVFNFDQSDARCYYNLCSNITPDSAHSLPGPRHPKGTHKNEAKAEEPEPIPILQPPPGFGDSSSDEEFFDARDRFTSPEDPTSGTVPKGIRTEMKMDNLSILSLSDIRVSVMDTDENGGAEIDKQQDEEERGGKETMFLLRKRSRKRRSFMETDYTSTVTYPESDLESESNLNSCSLLKNILTGANENPLLTSDPEPSEQTQNPSPTVSSLTHSEGEPSQLESKPILSKLRSHGPGLLSASEQNRDINPPSRTRKQEMEMEPDAMESKSVTDLVKVVPPTITVVRCRVPLEACGCPVSYTNCFSGEDSFDDELTVYEFSCRSQNNAISQTSSGGLHLVTSPPVPSFISTSSTLSPSFPNPIFFSSSTSEFSPLLSPHSDTSESYLSQTHKDTLSHLGQQHYPEPPEGFQVLCRDVHKLLSILEVSSSSDRSVEGLGGRHPKDSCPAHFTENKRVLQLEARRLMSGCQKVTGTGQSPEEMLQFLADSFRTLVELAGVCLWFSGCDRCDRRNVEAVAGLADVARSFRDFCLAAERASSKRSCQDLSTKLLAKQCTALTASVFCLTQLFRTLTAL
ncbi:hypothetical protein GOODEAATRI_014006, partial [Goodea atripinnis]